MISKQENKILLLECEKTINQIAYVSVIRLDVCFFVSYMYIERKRKIKWQGDRLMNNEQELRQDTEVGAMVKLRNRRQEVS